MSGRTLRTVLMSSIFGVLLIGDMAWAQMPDANGQHSITDRSVQWPTRDEWSRVLSLRDYNTRVVVIGAALLGAAAGMIGSFTLLRKRALMGDALAHATLPGICIAFILATVAGANAKSLVVLLAGGAVSGLAGAASILGIRRYTRLKEDAALGIVLSVYFGAGIAVLGIANHLPTGNAAGLETFIYGKTASLSAADAQLIGIDALASLIICLLLFKELKLLCFDDHYAAAIGLPVLTLDLVLMGLVAVVTLIGLQAVGLILIVALLVTPAAAARFWTQHMTVMTIAAALIGALSCTIGAAMSALFPKLPSGAMIVLVATSFFLISMLFAPHRGVLFRWSRRYALNQRIHRQHLLRGVYEQMEATGADETAMASIDALLAARSWSARSLVRHIDRAERQGLVERVGDHAVRLTRRGAYQAARLVHEHRLWEMYLIKYADIAASKVDRDADAIEHVLEPETIAELERLLEFRQQTLSSPHPLALETAESALPTTDAESSP